MVKLAKGDTKPMGQLAVDDRLLNHHRSPSLVLNRQDVSCATVVDLFHQFWGATTRQTIACGPFQHITIKANGPEPGQTSSTLTKKDRDINTARRQRAEQEDTDSPAQLEPPSFLLEVIAT